MRHCPQGAVWRIGPDRVVAEEQAGASERPARNHVLRAGHRPRYGGAQPPESASRAREGKDRRRPVELTSLPLHSRTPLQWGRSVLADPIPLLVDHAFLEKKAAANAMELLTRWPNDWLDGWVETMTAVARDETNHLAQVVRILLARGGRLGRIHKNPYANALRQ